jgi:hypothetical protein
MRRAHPLLRSATLAALVLLNACPAPPPPVVPEPPPAPTRSVPPDGARLPSHPELQAAVHAPARAPYDPNALGPAGRTIAVALTNRGTQTVAIGELRASFTASRDGVAFPCREHIGGSPRNREPSALPPGHSFTFERDLDCTMPLPGQYDVKVFLRLGRDDAALPQEPAGAFVLELFATSPRVPHPFPSRRGLYALMTGNRRTPPLSADEWKRGDYHVVVALINAGTQTVRVGAGKLAFQVCRQGAKTLCTGQAEAVPLPNELGAGAVHVVQAPIAGAPSAEGRYEIVGRLSLGDGGDDVEIGRIPLHVSGDPSLYAPEPWQHVSEPSDR